MCSFGPFRSCNYSKHNIFISPVSDVWGLLLTRAPVSWPLVLLCSVLKRQIFLVIAVQIWSQTAFIMFKSGYLGRRHTTLTNDCHLNEHVSQRPFSLDQMKTLSLSCVDNSIISLTDSSFIMSAVRTHLPLCVRTEPRGTDVRCTGQRTPDVLPQHIMPQHHTHHYSHSQQMSCSKTHQQV